jgi:signal transduction histidine kinase
MQNVMTPLLKAVKACSEVDAASVWCLDVSAGIAQLIAHSNADTRAYRHEILDATFIEKILGDDILSFQGAASALDYLTTPGYIAVWRVAEVGSQCYFLVGFQEDRPLTVLQLERLRSFVELMQALWTSSWGARRRVQGRLLSHHVRFSEERIRRQIAQLLHGPLQTKVLLLEKDIHDLRQEWLENPKECVDRLAGIETRLAHFRDHDLRALSHRLYPDLIQVGLVPALRGLKGSLEPRLKVRLYISEALQVLDTPIKNRLPESLRLDLYRVIEEAANNAMRHGAAQCLEVRLDYSPIEGICLWIQDDGMGWRAADPRPGFGLRTIERRLRRWHGRLTIHTDSAGGAALTIAIPYRAAPARHRNVGG